MDFLPDVPAESKSKGWSRQQWVSLVPYGINQEHPNAYRDILEAMWDNRDQLGYAWRILRDGCCDGCSLGTSGLHDWTMKGIHLCNVRLQLLRFNTAPAMDYRLLEDVGPLSDQTEKQLRKLGRLPVPMVRRKGDKGFRRVSWDDAVSTVADGLRGVDPKRLGWYMTSRGLTNEAYYAHQKVARFLGTNHVDTSARICHAPSTAGLSATVGCAATTCSYSDWVGADLVVLVGTNLANNQPVSTKYLHYAKKAGTKIFLVNPYVEPGLERYWVPSVVESALFGTKLTDDVFQIHAGGDIAFFHGVLKHLVENDWLDHDFINARTVGWPDIEAKVKSLSWETLERSAGQTRADMYRFAEAFGKARHAIITWSMGITQHAYGSDNVRAIVNLQLAKGNVGRPHTGLMPMRGHSGVQGGAEMGGMPGAYVMGFPANEENARKFASSDMWGFEPPSWKGLSAAHMVLAAERGEIDALWQTGGNFKQTLPEPKLVERALGKIKLRIHQDIVANPTMFVEPADTVVLLPSRTRYEQRGGGTETSTERRIIYSPEIPGPRPGEAKDEWEIPVLVARKLDVARSALVFPWKDTQDIRDEIDRVCPTYRGIASMRKKGDNFQYGGRRLLADRFLTPDGKGHFSPVNLPEEHVPEGRFLLATRRGKQFNSILLNDSDPLTGALRDDIIMSPDDAQRLGLRNGDAITLRNELGELKGRVRIDRIKPGCLQAHWPEANAIIPAGRLDPSGVPDYNATVEVVGATCLVAEPVMRDIAPTRRDVVKRSRSIDLTQVSEWQEGDCHRFQDYLVAEEPLEIRVAGAPLTVTMRTPGHDLELAAGFLFTEGLIQRREQITSLTECAADKPEAVGNLVQVELAETEFDRERMQRNFFAASSCGICGKASIDAIRVRGIPAPNPRFRFDPDLLCTLPDKLRAAQTIFGRTGGLHAAGLFSSEGELIVAREDVGRHNAVDKIVGWALLEGRLPLSQAALMVSGRGGFEIIQKALVAGLPLVASVSAPSGLAVRLARELGLTLVGFLRGRRFLIYSGEQRLEPAHAPVGVGP